MRSTALILVVLTAGGGLFGGGMLLADPDGSLLGLERELLPAWYGGDYRWAGLVLLVGFGLGGVATARLLLTGSPWGWRAVLAVGGGLLVWMVVQLLMIGLILPPMQLGFIAIAMALIAASVRSLATGRPRSASPPYG